MTYASPAWEFAANTHLLKLQRLQNKDHHHVDRLAGHNKLEDRPKTTTRIYFNI
jgi:hypothetical protein